MSKPFFADVGDFTTTNVGTDNAGTANDTIANLTLANISAQALVAAISPADIGGTTQNNYSPAGLATTGILNLTASSVAIITGIDASVIATGRLIYLYALPTNTGNVTINNEDAGSLAANRIDLPGAAPAVMTPGSTLALRYDGGSSRWHALSSTSSTQLPSLIVTGPVTFSGVITPASLPAGLTNDYNPVGLANAATIRQAVNANAVAILSGLTAQGTGGRRITIQNLGPGILTITSEDTDSTAANRFSMPGAATFELLTDGAITFLYDGTTSRWIAENMTQCVPFVQINTTTSPAAITGTVNNYNPTGLAVSGVIRQALSGSAILTGLVAQIDGRVIFVENIDTSFALTLNNEDAGSTAANRFTLPGGTALVVNPGGCIVLIYDNTSARWRTLGQIGATVPVSSPVFGLFGDGSDGPIHFDGIATITLGNNGQTIVPSGNAYTLPRDIFPTTVVIDAGVTVNEAGYFIFAKTSANGPGTLACNGGNGGNGTTVGGTGGTAAFANARYNNSGIAGVAGSIAGGTIGLINNSAPNPSPIGGGGAASGGNGTKANASGAGGSGGAGAGGAGVGNNPISSNGGGYKVLDCVLLGIGSGGTRFILTGCSGGSGGGSASIGGGGSGAGGGYVGLFTPVVLGPLTMQANGGNGGNGNAGGNSGGGGGGGGGYAFLLALIGGANVTIQINGGVGGAKGGTGTIGGNGFTGQQIIF